MIAAHPRRRRANPKEILVLGLDLLACVTEPGAREEEVPSGTLAVSPSIAGAQHRWTSSDGLLLPAPSGRRRASLRGSTSDCKRYR